MTETGTRRGFLIGALALMTAPAIVRVDSLMKVVPIDVYDTRCLWDYCIQSDEMLLRVDRRLETMVRPPRIQQIPLKVAKRVFGENALIFKVRPPVGNQSFAQVAVTSDELRKLGIVPPWAANVQERFV